MWKARSNFHRLCIAAFCISTCIPAIAAEQTSAQPIGVHFRSLEARIAKADLVFHGKISDALRTETVPPGGATPDGTTWPDGWAEYVLTVKVDENLKGGPKDKVSL